MTSWETKPIPGARICEVCKVGIPRSLAEPVCGKADQEHSAARARARRAA